MASEHNSILNVYFDMHTKYFNIFEFVHSLNKIEKIIHIFYSNIQILSNIIKKIEFLLLKLDMLFIKIVKIFLKLISVERLQTSDE